MDSNIKQPTAQLIEQPAERSYRFRYPSEQRKAYAIEGVNSTSTEKTCPTIKISNFKGNVEIVISCVSDTKPFRPHPHKLTTEKGGCYRRRLNINGSKIIEFKDLNILFTKKTEIVTSLIERKEAKIDPPETNWKNIMLSQAKINLFAIRLCFNVIFYDKKDKPIIKCTLISNTVKDKKRNDPPKIYEISATSSCISGGEWIMIFCDKVQKDDIQVVYYDDKSNWKTELKTLIVHYQYGIAFQTPPYEEIGTFGRKRVFMKLYRPSDDVSSKPISFEYYCEQSTQLKYKPEPKRHHAQKPIKSEKPTDQNPSLTSILWKALRNRTKDEPNNEIIEVENEKDLQQSTIDEILSLPNNAVFENSRNNVQCEQQPEQQPYPIPDMYRNPMTNHPMMNIQQPYPLIPNNVYEPNYYYPNVYEDAPADNNIADSYLFNAPMPSYIPTHNYNQIPDAQPIFPNTHQGYQMNNYYHPEMNAIPGPPMENPYTPQSNVPVYNPADDFFIPIIFSIENIS